MTKHELMQVRSLQAEIRLLEAERDRLNELLTEHVPPTTVKGSSPDYPYTMHTIMMDGGVRERTGGEFDALRDKADYLTSEIVKRKLAYCTAYERVSGWIADIPDGLSRQILVLRYLAGMEWPQMATRMGNEYSPEALRKRHDRILKKYL